MKETTKFGEMIKDLIKDPDFYRYCFFCDDPLFDGVGILHGFPCCEKCFNLYRDSYLKN